MQSRLGLNTCSFLVFALVTTGLTASLAILFPPDAEDFQAAPELAGMLGWLFPGSLVGSAFVRVFAAVGTPWVNRPVHPAVLAYSAGAGATGYACYLLGTLNRVGLAWAITLSIYAIGAALLAGLLIGLAKRTPLKRVLEHPIFGNRKSG